MKIAENILAILDNCRIEGNTLFLPPKQLDRKVYTAVNKCLENIGGKWNRKAKGHIFEDDPAEALENLILTGETEDVRKKFQFFPTPKEVAEKMCNIAELTSEHFVLEPSIGKGDLANVIKAHGVAGITGVELNPEMARLHSGPGGYFVYNLDFLEWVKNEKKNKENGDEYSNYGDYCRVIMNPPFSKQQDIDHIRAAFEMLKPGGILVSVASTSWQWRDNKKSVEFREWLYSLDYEAQELPEGSFKDSGTMWPTVIIKIRRDGELDYSAPEQVAAAKATEPERCLSFIEKFRLTKAS